MNFLNNREEFTATFGSSPFLMPSNPTDSDNGLATAALWNYADKYKLYIFMHLCILDYLTNTGLSCTLLMIEVPTKIQLPKVVNKYITPKLEDQSIDDLMDYGQYGNCLYKPKLEWSDDSQRQDIIHFNDTLPSIEL